MAIQPIDLSTVYSQMDKIGQFNATHIQNAAMSSRASMEKAAQQDTEKAKTVQESSKNKESNSIKADVNQGGGAGQTLLEGGSKNNSSAKKENTAEEELEQAVKKVYEIKDPNLGQHIDLLG
ncbi:MAG: hypothetical protein SPJ89_09595 [Treponema sp.]|nr:hypothetical protein [Spirochaetia bacterium]MDD7460770.1 hypothetical protein [Spirochaetales bacterium]MDY5812218.1 hypothetical protein [Treponema sp.]